MNTNDRDAVVTLLSARGIVASWYQAPDQPDHWALLARHGATVVKRHERAGPAKFTRPAELEAYCRRIEDDIHGEHAKAV